MEKTFSIVLIIIFCGIIDSKSFGDDDWTYDNQNEWDLHFKACNGSHESPINIDTTKVKIDSELKIKLHNYVHQFHKSTAQNNGHTVRVFLHPNSRNEIPYVSGKGVDHKRFILDSFHFHWGQNDFNGSEHSVNNVKRSAELHLVHWNSDYGNMSYAMDQKDGLLVITVFIETKIITDFGVIQVNKDNQAITPIINILGNIRLFSQSARIETPLDLESLVPKEMELFYKYEGSLTTPPCSPCATFIIFVAPIYMSVQQLSKFRQITGELIDGKSSHLTHNSRQQMPVNDRVVLVSDPFSNSNTKLD